MKKNEIYYKTAKYHYMLDYLLFSNDLDESLEHVKLELNDSIFLTILDTLGEEFECGYYPDKVFNNYEKIIEFLRKYYQNEEYLRALDHITNNYNNMEKKSGYTVYASEFDNKINDINKHKNNDCLLWNKEQMEELFSFDCSAILSFNVNPETYFENYFPYYICNQNYLYFIQKILVQYPKLLLEPIIKQRITDILTYNINIIEEESIDELIELFAIKNYNSDSEYVKENFVDYFTKFAEFVDESNRLLIRANNINKNNCSNNFKMSNLINSYYFTFIEKQFVDKEEIKENPILLGYLYSYIENVSTKLKDSQVNKKIIDMMSSLRQSIPKKEIPEYNEHLVMANSEIEKGISFVDYLGRIKLNPFEQYAMADYINKYQSYDELYDFLGTLVLDHDVVKSFICDDLEFESLYLKKFVYSDDFASTIKKLLDVYPSLFTDYTIFKRTKIVFDEIIKKYKQKELNSVNYYRKNLKIKRKVEKLYYGK